jgi:hypothetical protein
MTYIFSCLINLSWFRQVGVCPRTGKEYKKQNIDVSNKHLIPTHWRLFPQKFMGCASVWNTDVDGNLCRFLRAREYNVDKAMELYEVASKMREECEVDKILSIRDTNEIIWTNGTPHYHYGHDKLGRPFYIERSGEVKVDKLWKDGLLGQKDFERRHFLHLEYMSLRIDHAKQRYGNHVSQLIQIMDLKGLSIFGDSRGMTLFQDALRIDQNCYPEFLGNLFLINAPWIFRTMWAVIKSWIDPKTAAKFIVLGSDYTSTLLQYFDKEELPEEYGGTNKIAIPCPRYDRIPEKKPDIFDEKLIMSIIEQDEKEGYQPSGK